MFRDFQQAQKDYSLVSKLADWGVFE